MQVACRRRRDLIVEAVADVRVDDVRRHRVRRDLARPRAAAAQAVMSARNAAGGPPVLPSRHHVEERAEEFFKRPVFSDAFGGET